MYCLHLTEWYFLCLPYIRRRKLKPGGKKLYICQYHCYFWPLTFICSLCLCCFVRLTTGNKFLKQEARSEDPWGMYMVRNAAWASHKPVFSKAGCYNKNVFFFNLKYYIPIISGLGGSKFSLVVGVNCLSLEPSIAGYITMQKPHNLPSW